MSSKKKLKIAIIDYGINNTRSVVNALRLLNVKSTVTSKIDVMKKSDAIILPGVGAFGQAMKNLDNLNITESLKELTLVKEYPFLGICLGMQLMADSSEEKGEFKGLSLISGKVKKISDKKNLRVPHMGWNNLILNKKNQIFKNIENNSSFYFVHSYHYVCDKKYTLAEVDYGKKIVAVINHCNLYGVQFHPERSHFKGMKIIENFLDII